MFIHANTVETSSFWSNNSIHIYLMFTNSTIFANPNKVISWDQWPCWNNL